MLGVIKPGAQNAVALTKNKKIGVLGTHGTVNSKSYIAAVKAIDPTVSVYQQACPLFVPLVEEAMLTGPVPETVVRETVKDIVQTGIDTLILGCTHYPVLKPLIAANMPGVNIVDSTEYIINDIEKLQLPPERGLREILITDDTSSFLLLKNLLVGEIPVEVVTL